MMKAICRILMPEYTRARAKSPPPPITVSEAPDWELFARTLVHCDNKLQNNS